MRAGGALHRAPSSGSGRPSAVRAIRGIPAPAGGLQGVAGRGKGLQSAVDAQHDGRAGRVGHFHSLHRQLHPPWGGRVSRQHDRRWVVRAIQGQIECPAQGEEIGVRGGKKDDHRVKRSELDAALGRDAGLEGMLDRPHLGHQVGQLDQRPRGGAPGEHQVQHGGLPAHQLHDLF